MMWWAEADEMCMIEYQKARCVSSEIIEERSNPVLHIDNQPRLAPLSPKKTHGKAYTLKPPTLFSYPTYATPYIINILNHHPTHQNPSFYLPPQIEQKNPLPLQINPRTNRIQRKRSRDKQPPLWH